MGYGFRGIVVLVVSMPNHKKVRRNGSYLNYFCITSERRSRFWNQDSKTGVENDISWSKKGS